MLRKIKVLLGLTDFQKMQKDVDRAMQYLPTIVLQEVWRVIDCFKSSKVPLDRQVAVNKVKAMLKDAFPTVLADRMGLMRTFMVRVLEVPEADKMQYVFGYMAEVVTFLSEEIWSRKTSSHDERVKWMNEVAVDKIFIPAMSIIKTMLHASWKDEVAKSDLLDILPTLRCDPLETRIPSSLECKAFVAMLP